MKRVGIVPAWLFALTLCACDPHVMRYGADESDGTTATSTDDPGETTSNPGESTGQPQPLGCTQIGGACAKMAPATYTGPSLFWLGSSLTAPGCPAQAPYMGTQGFVKGSGASPFAFECLVTPSDLCANEGLTCVPALADFQICIHHDGDSACTGDYTEKHAMSDMNSGMPLTVCCEKQGPP